MMGWRALAVEERTEHALHSDRNVVIYSSSLCLYIIVVI